VLRRSLRCSNQGAVAVLVAVMILPLALLVSFAVDTSWKWVHDRHLQTQVDAGAFAAGQGPWLPTCDQNRTTSAIIKNATDYSGDAFEPETNTPRTPVYNPQYTNASNVQVLINSAKYPDEGGSDYSEDGKDPCQTLLSPSDPDKPAYVDLKASESKLGLFLGSLPGFDIWKPFRAHARVQLESQGGGDSIKPIAVRDDTAYVCAQAVLFNAETGLQIGTPITLARTTGPPTTPYTEFQNASPGASVSMPTQAQSIYVRVWLFANVDPSTGACTGNHDEFPNDENGAGVGGVNFINVFAAGAPSGAAPVAHSVTVQNGGCLPDQYFSHYDDNTSCPVTVVANIEFPAAAYTRNPSVDIAGTAATPDPPGPESNVWRATFSIPAGSGPHTYDIRARYNGCGNSCQSMGILQQAYSGLDADGEPSSSGPISLVQIGENAPGIGANSFQRQSTHNLVFTVRLQGLANSKPRDKAIILRYSNQGSKRTGLIDCGQGNGANADYDAIVNGCPRPVYIWPAGSTCVSPTNSPAGTPIDCVGIIPGNRRNKIPGAIRDRVGTSCNNWNAYRDSNGTTTFPPDDPRAITMIITSPVDLSGGGGSTADIPVLLFATFYVTGADRMTGNGQGCNNEPYPGTTGRDNSAIWGHWIKWADPTGTGTGRRCQLNEFGNCAAVLRG
jgi:hypothetical protein